MVAFAVAPFSAAHPFSAAAAKASSFISPPHAKALALSRPANPRRLLCRSSVSDNVDFDLPSVEPFSAEDDGLEMEVEKAGRNRRRIQSRLPVDADLEILWGVLTDYVRLADFIPGLSVSRLLDKRDGFARLYQVGEQNLALGLKFNAKGVIDCYEGDEERLPSGGRRRDIEFQMVEGDFHTFKGRWSIEQMDSKISENREFLEGQEGQEFKTTLSYTVELEPKLWLPVRLVEGRLCREVKTNLMCIREEAQRLQREGDITLPIGKDTKGNNNLIGEMES